MKRVTNAYEQKDITTLLKLEMEWVHKTTDHLEQLSDAKLKAYISALKQQVAELEVEKNAIRYNPRYNDVSDYFDINDKVAEKRIKTIKEQFKNASKEIKKATTFIKHDPPKKEVVHFATMICEANEEAREIELLNDLLFSDMNFKH